MKKNIFKGSGVAIVTPFTNDNKINYDEFKKLIDFQIDNNTDAIIVCGTTGESATLTDCERKELIDFTVKYVNHRIPVIAGTGSNNTEYAIELTRYAKEVNVDGVLVVTPYYNKTTQNGLIEHYKAIADSVSIPIIMYNVPSRTGLNIEPATAFELSKVKNIVAIKEASGNISQVLKIKEMCKDDLQIYSGNDDQIVPILSCGGIGVISVLANIKPNITHYICSNFFEGNMSEALDLQLRNLPLINALFCETNPIPIKYALNRNGFDVRKNKTSFSRAFKRTYWIIKLLNLIITLVQVFYF